MDEPSLGYFSILPTEIILHIVQFITGADLVALERTSKMMRRIAEDEEIWQMMYHNESITPSKLIPTLSWKENYTRILTWQWNAKKCSQILRVINNDLTVIRDSTEGSSPAILSLQPFSDKRNKFEIFVEKIGTWLSIGICTRYLSLENARVLGSQEEFFNAAYYSNGAKAAIKRNGELIVKKIPYIREGSRIAVVLEGDMIHFYFNSKLHGSTSVEWTTREKDTALYAAVSLSYGTVLTIQPKYRFLGNDRHLSLHQFE